ncbi:MAG: hypothetical protein K6F76_03220 [Clostridiales bacterium]|nr:hypothetical protein [Clostridiales bacterium]
MMNKIKQIGLSSIFIIIIMCAVGMFATVKTLGEIYSDSKNFEKGLLNTVYTSALSFSEKFEKNVPHGRYINSTLYFLSGLNNSDQVIIGKDNWLFYSSRTDGDSIADYEGTNRFTQEQLDKAADNMLETQSYLKDKGIGFCLITAPNKENVYYEYMPQKYHHTDITRTDKLLDYLIKRGVNAVNPKKDLLELSDKFKTYYKHDTHWNELGAYIGTKCVLDTFNIKTSDIKEDIITQDTKSNADLIKIADLRGVFSPDYGLTTSKTLHNTENISNTDKRNMLHIHNENPQTNKTVLVVGDSFREAMEPNLGYVFKNLFVVHRSDYSKDMIDEISPDYVILEFVERYSDQIMHFKLY